MSNVITALKPQNKNSKRINVFIDGNFAFSLSQFGAAWLRVGETLSNKKIESLQRQDSVEIGMQSALHFLSYRNRSEYEIRKNLINKGFSLEEIEKIIQELKDKTIINNDKFAIEWVENRTNSKPRGRRLLSYELTQKKVEPMAIEQALAKLPDEFTLALSAGRKIINRYVNLDKITFKRKLSNYLLRRGFQYAIVHETVVKLWEKNQEKTRI
jgi:regulatory protein